MWYTTPNPKQLRMNKKSQKNQKDISRQPLPSLHLKGLELVCFFVLTWLWASWWMGDVMRIAYERSYVAADSTLMYWLWQQSFGWLWIIGRALLTLYRWPVLGGLLVAVLLTGGSWLLGYSLHLSSRWRWLQFLPAFSWMMWTAYEGLNLFYMHEPGRVLAVPFLVVVICAIGAGIRRGLTPRTPYKGGSGHLTTLFILLIFALPMYYLTQRHPYLRPLTRMQVQLLHSDYAGISHTAHEHADMSYRPMAGYYVIALAHTGHLADQLFDIKLDFDTIQAVGYTGKPNQCMNYHIIDCNYHAGLIRAARHYAVEDLTMSGPSLYIMKMLVKMSLLEGDWAVARKYLHIINKAPFEGEFLHTYEPMVEHPELVQADPELAAVLKVVPPYHTFEQMYEKPGFVGFYANLRAFQNPETLVWSTVACLYSKRMPDFLQRCGKLQGTTPPRSISEGLLTQIYKYPDIAKAFPQLEMIANRYDLFLQEAQPYMQDRERGAEVLFEKYKGYYPYYYFFGNLKSTRKPSGEEEKNYKAGVN